MFKKTFILFCLILPLGGCGGKTSQFPPAVSIEYVDNSCNVVSKNSVPARVKGRIIILSDNGFEGPGSAMGAKALNYINKKVEERVALVVEVFIPEAEHGGIAIYNADLETFIYQSPGKKLKNYLFRLDKNGWPNFLYEGDCGFFKKIF